MSRSSQHRLALFLTILLGLATIFCAALVAGWAYSITLLGILCLCALPGLPWATAWFGRPSVANPAALVVGFSLGIVISLLLLGVVVRVCGWTIWAIVLSPVTACLPGCLYLRSQHRRKARVLPAARLEWNDYLFLVSVIIPMLVLLTVPLVRVGRVVGDNHVFHYLFGHDYLFRNAAGFEVLRGLPPDHLNWATQGYYYLYYTLHASTLQVAENAPWALDMSLPPHQLLGASGIYLMVAFVVILFLNVKAVLSSRFACYSAIVCGLFAYSYNGVYVLVKRLVALAVPALAEWLSAHGLLAFSDASKGWYRDFLVEQQAVLALIVFFTCFFLVVVHHGIIWPSMAAAVGVMVAGSFSSDSSVGTLGVLWLAVFLAWQLASGEPAGRGRVFVTGLVTGASAVVALAAAVVSGLAPLPSAGSNLSFALNKMIWVGGPVYLPLDFGPPLLLALAGLFLAYRGRSKLSKESWALFAVVLVAAISLAFIACLKHESRIDESVVLRKAGKVLRFALVILCGYYFQFLAVATREFFFVKCPRAILASVLLGVPTLVIDFAVFAGLYDDAQTSRISCADYEACDWLRTNTPREAVVQSLPEYGDSRYEMTPVAMIGGHALAMGNEKCAWSICRTEKRDFAELKRDVYSLFEVIPCKEAERILQEHFIAYVYVGEHERAWRPGGVEKYYANPQVFAKVYSCNGVDIFSYRNNVKGCLRAL